MRRVNYIDWMKALGMFFIIWGHLNPEYIKDCIYTFSVPSFFVISGFLFKPSDWQTFCKKNWVGLIVPYILLTTSVILFFAFVKMIFGGLSLSYFPESFFSCLIGDQNGYGNGIGCQAMWFVYTLFLAKILSNAFYDSWRFQFFICVVCWGAAVILKESGISFYSSYVDLLLAYPFFVFGWLVGSKYKDKLETLAVRMTKFPKILVYLSILILLCGLYVLSYYNGMLQMYNADFGRNLFLCLLGGVVGTILLAIIGMLFNNHDYFGIIATHSSGSIITLAWQIVFLFIIDLVLTKINILNKHDVVLTLLLTICMFGAFVPIIKIVQKHFPILLGFRSRKI